MFSHRERHGRALWGGSVLKPFNLPRTLRSARYQTTGRGHWQTLAIKPGPLPITHPPISQHLLLLSIEHQAEQLHSDHPGLLSYHNRVTGCCSTRPPYPTPVILPEDHPLVFPAEITGAAGQPQPNKVGQYIFNSFNQSDVRSRYPGLLLRPYAGKKAGWHFPLVGGSRVLITFLNGDPNRPLILGVLPHKDAPGPVTNKNARQHRIVTPAQNELTLDDKAPCIRLQSLSSDLHLELNAQEGEPFLRMAAHYGVISLKAAMDLYFKATQSTRHKIKQDRTTQIKNNHQTQAEENIHWQSGQHLILNAKQSLSQTAGETLQLQSGQDIHLTAQKNLTVKTQKGHHIQVPQGSLIKKIKGDITIEGQGGGDLILGNDTAGIKIDSQGKIKLYGKTINFKGSNVTFNGNVDYDPAGSNAPETAPKPEIPDFLPITPLTSSLASVFPDSGTDNSEVAYLKVHLKTPSRAPVVGVSATFKTPDGESFQACSDEAGVLVFEVEAAGEEGEVTYDDEAVLFHACYAADLNLAIHRKDFQCVSGFCQAQIDHSAVVAHFEAHYEPFEEQLMAAFKKEQDQESLTFLLTKAGLMNETIEVQS